MSAPKLLLRGLVLAFTAAAGAGALVTFGVGVQIMLSPEPFIVGHELGAMLAGTGVLADVGLLLSFRAAATADDAMGRVRQLEREALELDRLAPRGITSTTLPTYPQSRPGRLERTMSCCTCGDVLDEHDGPAGACLVDGCECICFEEDEEDATSGPDWAWSEGEAP